MDKGDEMMEGEAGVKLFELGEREYEPRNTDDSRS